MKKNRIWMLAGLFTFALASCNMGDVIVAAFSNTPRPDNGVGINQNNGEEETPDFTVHYPFNQYTFAKSEPEVDLSLLEEANVFDQQSLASVAGPSFASEAEDYYAFSFKLGSYNRFPVANRAILNKEGTNLDYSDDRVYKIQHLTTDDLYQEASHFSLDLSNRFMYQDSIPSAIREGFKDDFIKYQTDNNPELYYPYSPSGTVNHLLLDNYEFRYKFDRDAKKGMYYLGLMFDCDLYALLVANSQDFYSATEKSYQIVAIPKTNVELCQMYSESYIDYRVFNESTYDLLKEFENTSTDFISVPDLKSDLFSGGNGSEDHPYLIETPSDLKAMKTIVDFRPNTNFKLISDIDMEEDNLPMISTFKSAFNGNHHYIRNFTITNTGKNDYAGIFGQVSGNIKNLSIYTSVLEHIKNDRDFSAGIVGGVLEETGRLENVSVYNGRIICVSEDTKYTDNQRRELNVGSIVGKSKGKIINCTSEGNGISGYVIQKYNDSLPDTKTSGAYLNIGGAIGCLENGYCHIVKAKPESIKGFATCYGMKDDYKGPILKAEICAGGVIGRCMNKKIHREWLDGPETDEMMDLSCKGGNSSSLSSDVQDNYQLTENIFKDTFVGHIG